jgi:hypothetical protein
VHEPKEDDIMLNDQMGAYSNPDYQPIPPVQQQPAQPAPAQPAAPVKQARDKAQYVRQQKGHSLTKHLLLGWVVLWIPAVYYTFSPNHYWHA